ncbi:AMP-binding protein [Pseudonocardia acidicola]|uniref:AMP-binding protein n=1 Tax=Pseudonocardia acidicola TaxID=2724939 RepID=A0ABX1SH47_9PSEU|nr:AMP-binding protein [Pseudonocardia acidicola]
MRVIDFFDKGAARDPERTVLLSDSGAVTYAAATDHSWQVAAALHHHGIGLGARVGVLAPNVPEAFLAMLGLWRAGCSWVPLNTRNAVAATVAFMNKVGCRALFVHPRFDAELKQIRDEVPGLELVIALDGTELDGALTITAFLDSGSSMTVPDWNDPYGRPEMEACAWPTGGTTGGSKAVAWTNSVWSNLVETATRHWPAAERPVNLLVAPITHAAGVMAIVYAALGATIVMRPGFDADDVLDRIENDRVTHLFLPPTAFYGLLERQQARPRDCSSLTMLLLSAAPVAPDRLAQGVAEFGPCIGQCWGQSEAPFVLTYLTAEDLAAAASGDAPERLRSCGRATFGSQVAIMDDDGNLLPPGERGELVARGGLVTPGYIGDDAATAAVRTHGWHHTGDIGYLDADGYAYIVDRKSDMIISGGFNVYPAEVEAALSALPQVRQCAVVGVPHEKWGEAVVAVVVAAEDRPPDPDLVIAHARQALGPVKAPKAVVFVDELPQTPVGKVDKKALRGRDWPAIER